MQDIVTIRCLQGRPLIPDKMVWKGEARIVFEEMIGWMRPKSDQCPWKKNSTKYVVQGTVPSSEDLIATAHELCEIGSVCSTKPSCNGWQTHQQFPLHQSKETHLVLVSGREALEYHQGSLVGHPHRHPQSSHPQAWDRIAHWTGQHQLRFLPFHASSQRLASCALWRYEDGSNRNSQTGS